MRLSKLLHQFQDLIAVPVVFYHVDGQGFSDNDPGDEVDEL